MLNIDWPSSWDPDFREMLRLRLQTTLQQQMSKSRNSQLRGIVEVRDVFPGTVAPEVRLKHIHSLEPSLIALSISIRYQGDAYISLSGLEFNLDTTFSGSKSTSSAKGKGSAKGDQKSSVSNRDRGAHTGGDSARSDGGGSGGGGKQPTGGGDEDGLFDGDVNHSLPFFVPFTMMLGSIVLEDTVDVQIVTRVVDERPEYYFDSTPASTSTPPFPSSSSNVSLQQEESASSATAPNKPPKKPRPVLPLHVLVRSMQLSNHIDSIPAGYSHLLMPTGRHNDADSVKIRSGKQDGGGQEDGPLASKTTLLAEELSTSSSSSSAAGMHDPGTPLQPLTTETLHKQQLLEKKKSDVGGIGNTARSAVESPKELSMARSSLGRGSRTMDVLYGAHASRRGGAGRPITAINNLYSVARRGYRSSHAPSAQPPAHSGPRWASAAHEKSSGSSSSAAHINGRQVSWEASGSPAEVVTPRSGLRARIDNTPARLPAATLRTPRDDELKAGGATPARSIVRRGTGASTTSPPSASTMGDGTPVSRVTPVTRSLNASVAWPIHGRGGMWGSSFAFASGVPQLQLAKKKASLETKQRDFLASCLEPYAPYYPEGLSFLPPYWNLSAYNHITGAGSSLDSVVSHMETQCTSFVELFVFGRFKRVGKGDVSRREKVFPHCETQHDSNLRDNQHPTKGGTTIRLQFFSDPVKSFSVSSNFGSVHTRVDGTIESTLRNLIQPAIDKLLTDGLEFTV